MEKEMKKKGEHTCNVSEDIEMLSLFNLDERYFLFEVTNAAEWQHEAPPTHQGRQHRLHLLYC